MLYIFIVVLFDDLGRFSNCKSMRANDPLGGAILTPGAWLAGFIKRITIHCYTQNRQALGLVVSEKNIFSCFPLMPPERSLYGSKGQSWQDL